jgi:ABC-type sugar transport system ATPase subunit
MSPVRGAEPEQPLVETRGVVKRYPGVLALDRVDFAIRPGEIVGLVGKNGAGKSSLIKVIAGVEKPDEGELRIHGHAPPAGYGPHLAHGLGLAFVHQELGNFPELSVAENVALGTRYPRSFGPLMSRKELNARVQQVLDGLDAHIAPTQRVDDLTNVQQRLVMIARALYHDAQVLFLDEPSVSLTVDEIGQLHRICGQLRDRGHSIVYVSHRLNEILSLTDRVVLMKDGRVTLERETASFDEALLMDAIAGTGSGRRPQAHPSRDHTDELPVLSVRHLSRPPAVVDASFDLYRGEILGFAGLVGSGRTEIARMICGADRPTSGSIEVLGKPVRFRDPVDAIRQGIALLPEDRRHDGLILNFGVRENITLTSLRNHRLTPLLPFPRRRSERSAAADIASRLDIQPPGLEREVRRLSGGNQQKVVLAKWLHRAGRVLIFDEPTQGIDVGAKAEIFSLIQELADEGKAIIVICSDFSELETLCTRVVAVHERRVRGGLTAPHVTEEALVRMAYGTAEAGGVRV